MVETLAQREAILLAPYAMHSGESKGRVHAEEDHPYRGPFQRDRDRITHSAAYRRLSAKTQVFTGEAGDYHRTRLTHTLEVASVARTLGRALRLNEDLVESLALAHDIGHPPFGHAGEDTLDACLADDGGFNHNAQALRIVEHLERRYPRFSGLNLSFEVLEGQQTRIEKGASPASPLLEAQVVEAADSMAYDTHDADDAMELGLLTLEELLEVPLWAEAAQRVNDRFGKLQAEDLRRAILHELLDWQVGDLVERIERSIADKSIASTAEIRASEFLATPDPKLAEKKTELEAFLYDRVYRHPMVMSKRQVAQDSLKKMFFGYSKQPNLLPSKFQQLAEEDGLRRSVADYLSGMTDQFALSEYQRLFQQ